MFGADDCSETEEGYFEVSCAHIGRECREELVKFDIYECVDNAEWGRLTFLKELFDIVGYFHFALEEIGVVLLLNWGGILSLEVVRIGGIIHLRNFLLVDVWELLLLMLHKWVWMRMEVIGGLICELRFGLVELVVCVGVHERLNGDELSFVGVIGDDITEMPSLLVILDNFLSDRVCDG